jgi:putative ABC transport system substrate-binding protein
LGGREPERVPALARELVALSPDVIVAVTTTAALAAKKATDRIPIVAIGPADPVKSGLIASFARPGGNVTGVSPNQSEIAGKWLDLVREIVPGAKSLAYLTDRGNPGEMLVYGELEQRARRIGLAVNALDGRTSGAIAEAFAAIARERADALVVATTAALVPHRQQIVDGAARARLPAVYARREYVEAGGLLSYGTEPETVFSRAADYVDRIVKGAAPSELPFEMASTFTLIVNAVTARTQGVSVPQSLLARADRVIE